MKLIIVPLCNTHIIYHCYSSFEIILAVFIAVTNLYPLNILKREMCYSNSLDKQKTSLPGNNHIFLRRFRNPFQLIHMLIVFCDVMKTDCDVSRYESKILLGCEGFARNTPFNSHGFVYSGVLSILSLSIFHKEWGVDPCIVLRLCTHPR